MAMSPNGLTVIAGGRPVPRPQTRSTRYSDEEEAEAGALAAKLPKGSRLEQLAFLRAAAAEGLKSATANLARIDEMLAEEFLTIGGPAGRSLTGH
jgi:hypothetical protein